MQKALIVLLIVLFRCDYLFSSSNSKVSSKKYTFLKSKTYIENPFELRDPFKRMVNIRKKRHKKKFDGYMAGDVFSNLPQVEQISIGNIKLVGLLLGEKRRAMIKIGSSDQVFIIKEGMKLGQDALELKAILPGGIVFVEKIKNVYDQFEYLETIIPITED
ncbi:MAG: pilus assembly protein PilP [Bacteriovoracaceae bacterium]|nr:pilus assembly protein PilP [Bacteriovoracaceae bacterium]